MEILVFAPVEYKGKTYIVECQGFAAQNEWHLYCADRNLDVLHPDIQKRIRASLKEQLIQYMEVRV